MFQFMWEYMDYILQDESRLSSGGNPSVCWTAMTDLEAADLKMHFSPLHGLEPHFLIIAHFNELSQLSAPFSQLIQHIVPERVDPLVLMETDKPLFLLTGPQIGDLSRVPPIITA